MQKLTLEIADRMIDAAFAEGQKQGFAPLCVAVLDTGGHLLALKRSENASNLRPQIATGKARSVLDMGFGGRELARRAERMPAFIASLGHLSGGMVPVPGGVLIRDSEGALLGAIGITGDTSDNDEICAVAGVMAAGLTPDTGDAV